MADEMDTFLATVDEFVDDEERIVTCKWLCLQLAVPLHQSQEILRNYIDSCKKQKKTLEVIHTLTGRLKQGLVISLVKDQNLEKAKTGFDEVIASSLYSVQKGKLIESSVLYAADYESTRNSYEELIKLGGIEFKGAKKHTKEEIQKLRMTPGAAKDVTSDIEKQFAKPQSSKKPNINFFGKTSNTKAASASSSSGEKSAITKKSPQGVTNLSTMSKIDPFAKTQPKPMEVKQEVIEKPPATKIADPKKSKQTPAQRGVANFLTKEKSNPFADKRPKIKENKQTVVNVPKEIKPSTKSDEIAPKSVSTKANTKVTKQKLNGNHEKSGKSQNIPDELKIDDFSEEEDIFKTEQTKPKKKSSSKNIKKENPVKKRKRIECASSSSEDEDENEIVDVIPASPPRKRIQDSPVKETNKRMKKVLKTKTFADEEGCMVTEKYYEFEECNDAEPVATGNSNQPEKSTKKISPVKKKFPSASTAAQPKRQKQASIMGFFKKK